jgi:hypothetical protein
LLPWVLLSCALPSPLPLRKSSVLPNTLPARFAGALLIWPEIRFNPSLIVFNTVGAGDSPATSTQ